MSEVTAWGKITLNIGETGASDKMATDLSELGIVEEDSFALETEEGDKIQLFGTGHVLVDEKQLENIESVSCRVIVPSLEQITKFWEVTKSTDTATKTEIYTVHSTVSNKYYSIQFLPELAGAIKLEAVKTKPSCQLTFEEKKGWVLQISFTIVPVQKDKKPEKFKLSKKIAAAAAALA